MGGGPDSPEVENSGEEVNNQHENGEHLGLFRES